MDACTVRQTIPSDARTIDKLMSTADRLALHVPWSDVQDALSAHDFFLIEDKGQPRCVCGAFVGPDIVAQIQVFVLQDDWSVSETLAVLLPVIKRHLRHKGVKILAFVGMEKWLLEGLTANGFRCADTIVTLQKTDQRISAPGNPYVIVRSARPSDFTDILAIDQVAFEPLWRNTVDTLAGHLARCPYFVVAELGEQTVGYEYLSLVGRHGHLTRIAVHPKCFGQRIGVRLLAEAVHFFGRRRVFGITLNTQQSNHRARRLYEWFGFRIMDKEAQVLICTL
jgi:ribosomal protein S18 acetylase RimI-like enzyme